MATAVLLTLPPALAARAGTDTVLAAEDDMGLVEVYATAETLAAGERLRCFSMNDYAAIETLFAKARALVPTNDAETVLDTDAANVGRRYRGEARTVHSRPAGVRCRPGRAW